MDGDFPWIATLRRSPNPIVPDHRVSLDCRRDGQNYHVGFVVCGDLPRDVVLFSFSMMARTLNDVDWCGGQKWRNGDVLSYPTQGTDNAT